MPNQKKRIFLASVVASVLLAFLCACGAQEPAQTRPAAKVSKPLQVCVDEPATTDFQCTTTGYTVAYNAFNRLVEVVGGEEESVIGPSLAASWEISDDGLNYVFHLREGVKFSNGSDLTSSDVLYTFKRLLTHKDAANRDLVRDIAGAEALEAGETDELSGFTCIDDLNFSIELEQPFSAFLASLATPAASILDEQTTEEAGEAFGIDPSSTVGTGSYIFESWEPGVKISLVPNPDCWEGPPANNGVDLLFATGVEEMSALYDKGQLDILNVEDMGDLSDYYLHGDVFASLLRTANQVGIDYIALNESIKPLDDVRVRKALTLALDRQTLLDAAYGGNGRVENGIYPYGLIGHNDEAEEIPYDPDEAKRLLAQAGFPDGVELKVALRSITPTWQRELLEMVRRMWERVGVKTSVELLDTPKFMELRTSGKIAIFMATWTADYDDPDNFIYTFFGSADNTRNRSLCYPNEEVMAQVRAARAIVDEGERMEVYHELEKKIVQEDAAWIPLFSRERHFLVSPRVKDFSVGWNGWVEGVFKKISVSEE